MSDAKELREVADRLSAVSGISVDDARAALGATLNSFADPRADEEAAWRACIIDGQVYSSRDREAFASGYRAARALLVSDVSTQPPGVYSFTPPPLSAAVRALIDESKARACADVSTQEG